MAEPRQNHPELPRQVRPGLNGGTCAWVREGELDAVQERAVEQITLFEMAVGGGMSVASIPHDGMRHARKVTPKISCISTLDRNTQ